MRREKRKSSNDNGLKNIFYLLGTILGISIIAFVITFLMYNNNVEPVDTEKISDIVSNTNRNESTEQASLQISKTIEEVKEEASLIENEVNNISIFDDNTNNETNNNKNNVIENQTQETVAPETKTEETKKLDFIKPVDGNISKEFSKDILVYSNTLKEWVMHLGIDIEAEKTTVVKSVEDGEVTAIKTDPRYGITVFVKHSDGFETRYANLLTSEYVTVGETVNKGQTIGTVGNTATFEIADNSHLHFEMLKDNEYVNPNLYIK